MNRFMTAIPCAFGLIWPPATVAAPLPLTGTINYSKACSSPGGDFEGYRVQLTRNPRGARVTVEFSDDGSDGRETGRDLTFNSTNGALTFSFRGGDGDQYSFRGTASLEKLVGTFDVKLSGATGISRGKPLTLPTVKKMPTYLPPCDPRFPP